ncbi:YjmD (Zinc-containing alcohol dehydrogenase) [Mycolicibacterium smegmatis MC2 155]|uniref:YjmD (Zinc-containing alcohol dehydrogenase) n=1 Tax=Mycolicibacterium smegmatis (strain ATCC 700084 / mc(2)155) TaxID=246196 RepID=I7FYT6_MYCS2|nr:YjmD (Zinc-containing alcohol dehydrogenase) [Mycolicibacterium smegmatis MC2 155]
MTTSRVARTGGPGRLTLEDRKIASPHNGEAVVRVENVTLCGTDLHIWEGEYLNPFPIVQGHEAAGIVESVGDPADASSLTGTRVVISPVRSCGDCHACRTGRENVCERVSVLGCYEDGTLATRVVVPVSALHQVPDAVPSELAPLSEPASIALQAVRRGRPVAGELALVLGCGPIGLITIMALRRAGVDVVAVDTVEERARFAERFGAVATIAVAPGQRCPSHEEVAAAAGSGPTRAVSLVIEATGSPAALASAIDVVSHAGRVVIVGISDQDVTLPHRTIAFKELDVLGSRNSVGLIPDGLGLIAQNQAAFSSLITHRFPFEETADALRTLRTDTAHVRKVLISMGASV